jgi:hypothetical protein
VPIAGSHRWITVNWMLIMSWLLLWQMGDRGDRGLPRCLHGNKGYSKMSQGQGTVVSLSTSSDWWNGSGGIQRCHKVLLFPCPLVQIDEMVVVAFGLCYTPPVSSSGPLRLLASVFHLCVVWILCSLICGLLSWFKLPSVSIWKHKRKTLWKLCKLFP